MSSCFLKGKLKIHTGKWEINLLRIPTDLCVVTHHLPQSSFHSCLLKCWNQNPKENNSLPSLSSSEQIKVIPGFTNFAPSDKHCITYFISLAYKFLSSHFPRVDIHGSSICKLNFTGLNLFQLYFQSDNLNE